MVLADGSEVTVRRGETRACVVPGLTVATPRGPVDVPVPSYRMPEVVKRSAGYHAEPDMDLIDLFIGSEGTLGVITTVTFRALSPVPTTALALAGRSEPDALALVADLRQDPAVAEIEHMDWRCLEKSSGRTAPI